MKKYTFEDIEKEGLVLYKYVRGSHLYGLNNVNSDIDTGGVYYAPIENIIGLGLDYCDEVSDAKHDNVIYELKKFFNLLRTSNPTMLESLFVDEEHVIFEHPVIKEIRKYRESFLSKELYKPFVGYAESQIKKATGLHKLCVNPVTERKDPLDFCFTPYKQGSSCIKSWLDARGLEQKYCGLVSLNNMPDCYGVYYDWGAHNKNKYKDYSEFESNELYYRFVESTFDDPYIGDIETFIMSDWFDKNQTPLGYRGIVKDYSLKIPIDQIPQPNERTPKDGLLPNEINIFFDDGDYYIIDDSDSGIAIKARIIEEDGVKYIVNDINKSDTVRCSSIPKNESPICVISYNKDGFTQHCNKYRQYQEWVQKRNKVRYEENKEKTWDGKNMMHCLRLLTMAQEIFEGKGVCLNRRLAGDADFFLKVRNHEFEYEYISDLLEKKLQEVNRAYESTSLPENIDTNFVNNLLLDTRKKLFNLN